MKIIEPSVELIWITPNAEKVIELAGRVCYVSGEDITEESYTKFIETILSKKHESVLEHASACFRIICDRGVSHELVRHRLASYSQESTRYCNYSKKKFGKEITVIEPPGLSPRQRSEWSACCIFSEKYYTELLSDGASAQIARSVLPTCLKTELFMSTNFREWRHIISLRTSNAAHPQIREIMKKVAVILVKESPNIFGDLIETDWY